MATLRTTIGGRTPLGYQQITRLSTAQALGVPVGARIALIQAEVTNVRWRDDGTNPTSSVGMLLAAGEEVTYEGALDKFKAIEVLAGAQLNITYWG